MHASSWVQLIRRIPADQIPNLLLMTTAGTELNLQSIVHCDGEFLVVRARMAGTSDAGRAFFIPYDQIHFLGLQKPLKEEQVRAMFDGPGVWPVHAAPPVATAAPPPAEADPLPPFGAQPESPPDVAPQPSMPASGSRNGEAKPLPSKSRVLANLRARLKPGAG